MDEHLLHLPVQQPFHATALARFLADHAVPGLERGDDRSFERVLTLPHGHGVVALELHVDHVAGRLQVADARDVEPAVDRVRHLLDLDTDPEAVDGHLASAGRGGSDLADLVAARPGLRVPGTTDVLETAVRTVVGQQVSVSGARTVIGQLLAAAGAPVDLPLARELGLRHAFPTAEALAALDPETLPMPRARGRTVVGLAHAVASGALDLAPGRDPDDVARALVALPGIGPWTAGYVRMRGLGDPDVLLETDLVLRRILQARGVTPADTRRWSPWRSYAGMHLWTEHLARQAAARSVGRDRAEGRRR